MRSVKEEFTTVNKLVLHMLEHYPETRSNDNLLYLKCAKHVGMTSLEDMANSELSIVTVHKERQKIQNKMEMFKPSEETRRKRKKRAKEVKQYMIS